MVAPISKPRARKQPAKPRPKPSISTGRIIDSLQATIGAKPAKPLEGKAKLVSPEHREALILHYKRRVSKWPPMVRLAWLSGVDVSVHWGEPSAVPSCYRLLGYIVREPGERRKLEKQLLRLIRRTRAELHGAWLEAWGVDGIHLPRGETVRMKRVRRDKTFTFRVRRKRGEGPSTITRTTPKDFAARWTPPQCLRDETLLDLGFHAAENDGSISADLIHEIAYTKATEGRQALRPDLVGIATGNAYFTECDGYYSRQDSPKFPPSVS